RKCNGEGKLRNGDERETLVREDPTGHTRENRAATEQKGFPGPKTVSRRRYGLLHILTSAGRCLSLRFSGLLSGLFEGLIHFDLARFDRELADGGGRRHMLRR